MTRSRSKLIGAWVIGSNRFSSVPAGVQADAVAVHRTSCRSAAAGRRTGRRRSGDRRRCPRSRRRSDSVSVCARRPPVRQAQIDAETAVDRRRSGPATAGCRRGRSDCTRSTVPRSDADRWPSAVRGQVAPASRMRRGRSVRVTTTGRLPSALVWSGRRQGDADAVVDAGLQQPPLQLGHLLGIVALALGPGRQAGDPVRDWSGRASRAARRPAAPGGRNRC